MIDLGLLSLHKDHMNSANCVSHFPLHQSTHTLFFHPLAKSIGKKHQKCLYSIFGCHLMFVKGNLFSPQVSNGRCECGWC